MACALFVEVFAVVNCAKKCRIHVKVLDISCGEISSYFFSFDQYIVLKGGYYRSRCSSIGLVCTERQPQLTQCRRHNNGVTRQPVRDGGVNRRLNLTDRGVVGP